MKKIFTRKTPIVSTHALIRNVFLRCLAAIYTMSFLLLLPQVTGLIGSEGISPASLYLEQVSASMGWEGYLKVPSLLWLNSSDTMILAIVIVGGVLGVLAMAGYLTAISFFLMWVCYLTLQNTGTNFFAYQWDLLLLETGFLAIFFAPLHYWPSERLKLDPNPIILWLFRWLLFRLMFSSGVIKIAAGDASWRSYTAMMFHYETQPLPSPMGWYFHHLPDWFHQLSVGYVYFVELFIPFLIFLGRKSRIVAALMFISLQLIIMLTGNYGFFNLLSIVLCLLLLDDQVLYWLLPLKQPTVLGNELKPSPQPSSVKWIHGMLALLLVFLSIQPVQQLFTRQSLPSWLLAPAKNLEPLRLVNSYGLFAIMTTKRYEIVIEGTLDGENWQPYRFKHKPELEKIPAWVAPYHPRLDWQMWFASLSPYQNHPWFLNLIARLLQNSPEVVGLLESNPFGSQPPLAIRALKYEFKFASWEERKETGHWWKRQLVGIYLPKMSLKQE